MSRARVLADFLVYPKSHRNMIINGAMNVAQRGTSLAGVTTAQYANGPDRFKLELGNIGTYTISQESEWTNQHPSGFRNSYKIDCTTADASPAAGDYMFLQYRFEGHDLQRIRKGASGALPITLSFWVKSNLTGTWQVNLQDNDNNRIIGQTYTISSGDTWEQKSLTFAGDTTGAFGDDNNHSATLEWALGSGTNYSSGAVPTSWESHSGGTPDRAAGLSGNLASSTSNTFHITGVQLELGSTATPFEHRTYAEELVRCQRYFQDWLPLGSDGKQLGIFTGWTTDASWYGFGQLQCEMNHTAAFSVTNGSNYWRMHAGGSGSEYSADFADLLIANSSQMTFRIYHTAGQVQFDPGESGFGQVNNNLARITAEAEL